MHVVNAQHVVYVCSVFVNSFRDCSVGFVFIPRISLAGEDSLHEGLRWHPFDWQHGSTTFPIIAGPGKRKAVLSHVRM